MVRRWAFALHDRQFELIKEAQGCTTLFLHDTMRHLAIKTHFQHAQRIFNQVEIIDLCLFVSPDSQSIK